MLDPRTITELLRRVGSLERAAIRFRLGEVTDDSPLSLTLGGSDISYTDVQALAGLQLTVGDTVAVLTFGNDLLVLGRLWPFGASRSGVTAVSFTTGAADSAIATVTHGLGATPRVVQATVNGTGGPSLASAQAFNIGATTFQLQARFLNGTAAGAVSLNVGWTAER